MTYRGAGIELAARDDAHRNIKDESSQEDAGIAQLVEHNLAKVGVASSSLVSRSKLMHTSKLFKVSREEYEASAI